MTIETRYSVSENIIKYHQNSEICLIFKNCFPLIYTAVTVKSAFKIFTYTLG